MAIHTFSDKQPRTTTICVNYQTKCSSSIREDDIFFEGCEHHLYYFIVFIASVSHLSIYFSKFLKIWKQFLRGIDDERMGQERGGNKKLLLIETLRRGILQKVLFC